MHDEVVVASALRKVFPRKVKREGVRLWARLLRARSRTVEPFVAVDGVSFSIRAGEIFGLLGPNGAGKTTTIRMLCTLLEPTSGTATVNGYDVLRQTSLVRQSLGAVLTGERSIYWKLTARENLAYFAALYHIPPAVARRRIDELLARLDLAAPADEYVERYSSGMKQRLAIARALLANPPVLLLDEPTIGLDPQSARNLRELILEIRAQGRTILLTTHYMEEADQLCDRVGIIDSGTIIALDTPAGLKRSIQQLDVLQLELENVDPALCGAVSALPAVEHVVAHPAGTDGVWSLALHTTDSRWVLPGLIVVQAQTQDTAGMADVLHSASMAMDGFSTVITNGSVPGASRYGLELGFQSPPVQNVLVVSDAAAIESLHPVWLADKSEGLQVEVDDLDRAV